MKDFFRIKSISELHQYMGIRPPSHPLLSVIDFSKINFRADVFQEKTIINDFYLVSLKGKTSSKLLYGRNYYDFAEGSMIFMSPAQVFQVGKDADDESEGWGLYFHPDLIVGTSLFDKMADYNFFNYDIRESLHLSDKERIVIEQIIENITTEYNNNLDKHSQHLIVSNIELLLNYCKRFYDRQFITRHKHNKDVIHKFEQLLKDYYKEEKQSELGLITLDFFATELHLSKSYLSDLIKKETGKTVKESIHLHIIGLAKNSLISTNKSISEVAYGLGFEYPQYFSRLFKSKVGITPNEYRKLN